MTAPRLEWLELTTVVQLPERKNKSLLSSANGSLSYEHTQRQLPRLEWLELTTVDKLAK